MENLEEEIKKISQEIDKINKNINDSVKLRDLKYNDLKILKEKEKLKKIYGLSINEIISLLFKEYEYTIYSDTNFFYFKFNKIKNGLYIDQINKLYGSYNYKKKDFYLSIRDEQSICLYFDLDVSNIRNIIKLFNIEINDCFVNKISKELGSLNKRIKFIEDLGLIFL